jgi:hypothetical protein
MKRLLATHLSGDTEGAPGALGYELTGTNPFDDKPLARRHLERIFSDKPVTDTEVENEAFLNADHCNSLTLSPNG